VTTYFLAQVEASDLPAIGQLRQNPDYSIAEIDGETWLRGKCENDNNNDAPNAALRGLPCKLFRLSGGGDLIPWQLRVPQRRLVAALEESNWQPLSEWLQAVPPIPALAGQFEKLGEQKKATLHFQRSKTVSEANLLVTSINAWEAYATTAPKLRLDRLSFAMNEIGNVVVQGEPLPPLPGRRFVETDGIAVEAGWAYSPPLVPRLVAKALGLAKGDIALLLRDQPWEHLPMDAFVLATRSAVRLSARFSASISEGRHHD